MNMQLASIILKSNSNSALSLFFLIIGLYSGLSFSIAAVPKGFEQFLEKQTTIADIYYGGTRVGESLVSYDLEHLWFEEPRQVASLLKDIKKRNKMLQAFLNGAFPRNSDRVCHRSEQDACAALRPDVIAIVFDESRFRVDIFIHQDYRMKQVKKGRRYQKFSPVGLSSVHSLSAYTSQDSTDTQSQQSNSLAVTSTVSLDQHRIRGNFLFDQNISSQVNQLSYVHEDSNNELELGYMQSFNHYANHIVPRSYYGLSWRNHLKHRLDLSAQRGSEVSVFLENDSRIEIFRGDSLISVEYLAAGNQVLDTTYYPDGAYFLDIKISDSFGRSQDKREYFVKSTHLPPLNESLWMLEMGITDNRYFGDELSETSQVFLRTEKVSRLFDNLGYSLGVITSEHDTYFYTAWESYWERLQWRQEMGQSSHGYWQYSQNLSYGFFEGPRIAFSMRKNSADERNYFGEQITSPNSQRQVLLTIPFSTWQLTYSYQDLKSDVLEDSFQGINLRYRLATQRSGSWMLLFDWIKSSASQSLNLRVQYSYLSPSVQGQVENGRLTTRSGDNENSQILSRFNLNGRAFSNSAIPWRGGVNVLHQEQDALVTVRNSLETPYINVDSAIQYGEVGNQSISSGYANLSANIVTTGGKFYFGGKRGQGSGVVVELGKDELLNDATFVILLDDIPVKKMNSDSAMFVPIPSHKKVRLRVKQVSGELLNLNFKERTVSLMPGQVDHMTVDLTRLYVVVGQLVDVDGEPLANARVGERRAFHLTDDLGWFQIERDSLDKLDFFLERKNVCSVHLRDKTIQDDIIWLDKVSCVFAKEDADKAYQ